MAPFFQLMLYIIFIMVTCPPFRVFVNPVGITPQLTSFLPSSLNRANIFTDIAHLSQWYWMLCCLTIDLSYTINGDFSIHHTYTVDKTQTLPPQRILPSAAKFSLEQQDTSLEITAECDLNFCNIYLDEHSIEAYKRSNKDYQHDVLLLPQTQIGLFLNFVENADNGDFYITTTKSCAKKESLLDSFSANFIGCHLPFYLYTQYPDDIEGKIDNVIIKYEFFEVKEMR